MTCNTTHHACDCVLKRMKKLEAVFEAAKDLIIEMRINTCYDHPLTKAIYEMECEWSSMDQ
jgi:hypothetical protein